MNFFLFVIFGAVSAFNSNILLNPREFVASVQNADPATVQKLIDYANQLITEGEDVRADVIGADEKAAKIAADAATALEKAVAFTAEKTQKKKDAVDWLALKQSELVEATDQYNAAIAHLEESTAKFNEADDTMNTELARIAQEDIDLKEVRNLLNTLMPEFIERSLGRSLLTTVDASIDPAGVQAVINLVNNLLIEGQKEADNYRALRNAAKDVLDAATADHAAKEKVHTHAVGAESVGQQLLREAEDELKDAQHDEKLTREDKARKDDSAADAKAHRIAEVKRINGEKADFEDVIALLTDLLPKE